MEGYVDSDLFVLCLMLAVGRPSWYLYAYRPLIPAVVNEAIPAHTGALLALCSLMLDFKCVVNPYHFFTTSQDWNGTQLSKAGYREG
jgi:hypothetical protein